MAKKKVAKKAAKSPVKKAVKAAKKPVKKAKSAVKKAAAPVAAAADATQPVMVDVSEQEKKDSLEMPPPPAETKPADTPAAPASGPVEKHEEFTQALTQEPPKKGFWSRLFGK